MTKHYKEGWKAFSDSLFRCDNPYQIDTPEYYHWGKGWQDHYVHVNKNTPT